MQRSQLEDAGTDRLQIEDDTTGYSELLLTCPTTSRDRSGDPICTYDRSNGRPPPASQPRTGDPTSDSWVHVYRILQHDSRQKNYQMSSDILRWTTLYSLKKNMVANQNEVLFFLPLHCVVFLAFFILAFENVNPRI